MDTVKYARLAREHKAKPFLFAQQMAGDSWRRNCRSKRWMSARVPARPTSAARLRIRCVALLMPFPDTAVRSLGCCWCWALIVVVRNGSERGSLCDGCAVTLSSRGIQTGSR